MDRAVDRLIRMRLAIDEPPEATNYSCVYSQRGLISDLSMEGFVFLLLLVESKYQRLWMTAMPASFLASLYPASLSPFHFQCLSINHPTILNVGSTCIPSFV